MKGLCHICLTFLFCILTSCEGKSKTDRDEIPVKDRFSYNIGDKLTYRSIDGKTNSVVVKENLFWTQSGIASDMFGGSHPWERHQQEIIIESSSESWQKALSIFFVSDSFNSRCIIIRTIDSIYDLNGDPYCFLLSGCSYGGGLPIFAQSGVKHTTISFNNNLYEKVYYTSRNRENNSFAVYWNLKYGIIRFETVIEGKQEIWDLENPRL